MEDHNLLAIASKVYPSATGIMLSGSQISREDINLDHDVDLVILNPTSSVVSTNFIVINNVKFDFTLIPLNDVENSFFNEAFDPKGKVFSMIKKGRILKDTNNVFSLIKLKVEKLYNQINPVNLLNFNDQLSVLRKLRIDFDRHHEMDTIFFLLNDFFATISNAEVIRLSNWNSSGKHKASFLIHHNPDFVRDLIEISQSILRENQEKSRKAITTFIDNFLSIPFHLNLKGLNISHVYLELSIDGARPQNFISAVIALIKEDVILSKYYLYSFLSPKNYFYVHKLDACIVFNNSVCSITDLLEQLKITVSSTFQKVRISSAPTYAYAINRNKNFDILFEGASIELNSILQVLNQRGNGHDEETLLIYIILSSFLYARLGVGYNDMLKIVSYLGSRSLYYDFAHGEMQVAKDPTRLRKSKFELYLSYYNKNSLFIDKAVGAGLDWKNLDASKIYYQAIQSIDQFIVSNKELLRQSISDNHISLQILSQITELEQPDSGLIYVLIMERLSSRLFLSSHQSAMAIFIMAESLSKKNQPGEIFL